MPAVIVFGLSAIAFRDFFRLLLARRVQGLDLGNSYAGYSRK